MVLDTMMNKNLKLLGSLLLLGIGNAFAQNPIVQTMYTADPAPMVYNDKMYLYTSHDEDNSTWFVMDDWKLYTTEDMVNWTDHGVVASYKTFHWAKGDAWAIQVVERDGKFYLYAPITSAINNRPAIGVAVADSPYGPFYDPLGHPLVQTKEGDIDPTVFIDDDRQAHLYWGNPFLYHAKLNEDMISLNGNITEIPMTSEAFGVREGNVEKRPTLYEEAPWLYKREGLYYLLWGGGPIPEHLGYSTSESPVGPWKYGGTLMPTEGRSFTNHPGIVDFKGNTYLFYHNGALPGGSGFTRSVAVEEVEFTEEGEIKPLKMTQGVTEQLKPVNPYRKVEAETIAWSEHVKAKQNVEVGVFVQAMQDGAYTSVKEVDFATGASKFTARIGTTHNTGVTMEVRLDGIEGQLLTTMEVPRTGGDNRWSLVSSDIPEVSGKHDVYFVFKAKSKPGVIMYFDYWMFSKQNQDG